MKLSINNLNPEINKAEAQHILETYRTLYNKLTEAELRNQDHDRLKEAFRLITEAYKGMRKSSGLPYLYRPIEIATITAEKFQLGTNSIIAALLQDMVYNKKTTITSIQNEFGDEIAEIVSKLGKLAETNQASLEEQAENLKSILSSFSVTGLTVILIKIAEYLYKMRELGNSSPNDQNQIIQKVKHIYIPLAQLLGLHHIQLELEDMQLKLTHSEIYEDLVSKIQATRATKEGFLERFIAPIHAALKQEDIKQYIIKGRTKSAASIWKKLNERNIAFEDMHDLYAIRIIFDGDHAQEYINCWLVYELVTSLYEPRLDRLRDWITYPKESGYEALHITVLSPEGQWVEVQIRTNRMDDNAEHGDAAHWKYKDQHLTKAFVDINPSWFEQAKSFLIKHWAKDIKDIDIRTHDLYIKRAARKANF